MSFHPSAFAALIALAAAAGCASTKSDRQQKELDELWRGGYGFNNPNPERMKKGLDPVNLDGKEPAPWWLD